jgi:hypothetical protein
VETDGEVIRILDVSLEAINDGDASSGETIDEDEDTLYGGPVSCTAPQSVTFAFVTLLYRSASAAIASAPIKLK